MSDIARALSLLKSVTRSPKEEHVKRSCDVMTHFGEARNFFVPFLSLPIASGQSELLKETKFSLVIFIFIFFTMSFLFVGGMT